MYNPSNKLSVNYPCGIGGLNSNKNTFRISLQELVLANNIRFDNMAFNKAPGLTSLGTAIAAAPTCLGATAHYVSDGVEKTVSAWSNGNVYKSLANQFDTVNLGALGATTEPVIFAPCANLSEAGTAAAKRLGIWSKNVVPKQLVADAATFSNLTSLSADWATQYPSFAIYHDFRQIASGLDLFAHNLYFSDFTDVMRFTGGTSKVISLFPGEGDYISALSTYIDAQLLVFKYPVGIYLVDTTDLTASVVPRWKVTDKIGCAGPKAVTKVGADTFFISGQGRIHQLSQVRPDIDPIFSDLTNALKLSEFIKENVDLTRIKWSTLHYDELRQELIYSFTRIGGSSINDCSIIIKFNDIEGRPPTVSIDLRGEYVNAVWGRIDSNGRHEVLCAGGDGKVLQFNASEKSIDGEAFTAEFSHPPTDFGFLDPKLSRKEKRFDWLEIFYLPSGTASTLLIDIIVDGEYRKTLSTILDASSVSTYDFSVFDTATYAGNDYQRKLLEIDSVGTKLALKCYNNAVDEDFSIVDMNVYMDVEGDQNETA
jgi:hypothetical protein